MTDYIEFTPVKLRLFKKAYNEALATQKEIFFFEGHEILVGYAKYLIQHVEQTMEEKYDER